MTATKTKNSEFNAELVRKELIRREMARRSLCFFTEQTLPGYQAGWVHQDICKRLERFSAQVVAKQSPRLMLLMPPRHGKSELASIRFPAWHLGSNPTHEIINVGYNMDLPMKFSRKVRDLMRDPLYTAMYPDAYLNPDSQSIEAWNTMKGGGFTAAGVGGGITGKGAHILIVDDPLKNQEEADNAATRDKLQDWYQSTAYTRLAPGGGVLVIETWWNDDDLAGRLQAHMATDPEADQFEVVRYPALSEAWEYRNRSTMAITRTPEALASGDLDALDLELLRPIDTCLHEDRYPTPALKRIRANMEPRIWSALYQQNPVPDEGMYFQKEQFRYVKCPNPGYYCNIYTAWDFAIGEKQQNDWTVGVTIAQDEFDCLHVLDMVRLKGDAFVIVEAILDQAKKWGATHGADYKIGVEDGQIFKAIESLLKRRMSERQEYPVYEVLKPFTDKMARARPLQGRMQQGRVYFPEEYTWTRDMVQEMLRFPAGVHDDIVDALAWAVRLAMTKAPPSAQVPVAPVSWRSKLDDIASGAGGTSHMSA